MKIVVFGLVGILLLLLSSQVYSRDIYKHEDVKFSLDSCSMNSDEEGYRKALAIIYRKFNEYKHKSNCSDWRISCWEDSLNMNCVGKRRHQSESLDVSTRFNFFQQIFP